jgi:Ca-activated chloride channel family protein
VSLFPGAVAVQTFRSAADGQLELWGGISFADPLFLLGVLAAVVAGLYGAHRGRVATLRIPVVPPRLAGAPRTLAQTFAWLPDALRIGAAILVAVALARPLLGRVEVSSSTEGIDIALVVDRSTSMELRDVPGAPRRIDIVREVVGDYARRRTTDREGAADDVALFAFARFTDLLVPFTRDAEMLGRVIESLDVVLHRDQDGTGIGVAVATAAERLRDTKAKSKVIVLLTDGEETGNVILPAEATKSAVEWGVRVHVVYAGPRNPVVRVGPFQRTVDLTDLREMAASTGGRFFHAEDATALQAAYAAIEELERTPREESSFAERFDLYPSELVLALVLYSVAWVLAATWLREVG